LGSVITDSKSNEIPAARQLLAEQDLLDKILIADAMHTQDETGQQILFEKGADYLLTVKGNQSTLQTNLEKLFEKKSFSPSAHSPDPGAQTGAQPQPVGDPTAGLRDSDAQPGGLSRSPVGGSFGNPSQTPG
jgi:hypothetical protein